MTPRLLVVFVDGGDDDVVRGLAEAGRLPTIHRLMSDGASFALDTPCEELDLCVWAPMVSGEPPGEHGLAHFLEFDAHAMGLRLRRESDLEPFWLHLPDRGRGVVALDVPESHPHPASNAEEACCWHGYSPSHAPVITSRRLRRHLRRRGSPPVLADPHAVAPPAVEDRLAGTLIDSVAFQAGAVSAVSAAANTVCVGFHQHHAVVHWFGHHQDPSHWHRPGPARPELVAGPYEALDRGIASMLAGFAGANIVVIFARGIRPGNQSPDLIDGLLERAGYQHRLGGPVGAPGTQERGADRRPLDRLRAIVPAEARERIATAVLPSALHHRLVSRAFSRSIAWDRTQAFALPAWDAGMVRVNLTGRERDGIVDRSEYGPLLSELTALLHELRDADTGRELVGEVVRAQHRYPGSRADRLPDLLVKWAGRRPATRAYHPRFGTWTAPFREGRWTEHNAGALVVLHGPSVASPGATLNGDILDLAPTLLALRGSRRPSSMPGRPWDDVLRDP